MMGKYLYIAFCFTLFFRAVISQGIPIFNMLGLRHIGGTSIFSTIFLKRETVFMSSSLLPWVLKIFRYGVYTLMTVPWELTLSYKNGSTPRREAKMKMAELLSLKVFRLP